GEKGGGLLRGDRTGLVRGGGRLVGLRLLHALLELVLGRTQVAGQLGDGGPAEEQHHHDHQDDDPVNTEDLCQHRCLLARWYRWTTCAPYRLDLRGHGPASSTPMNRAATDASPAMAPQAASPALDLARVWRRAASPARATTTILAISTTFQAVVWSAKWKVETFQKPVTTRT